MVLTGNQGWLSVGSIFFQLFTEDSHVVVGDQSQTDLSVLNADHLHDHFPPGDFILQDDSFVRPTGKN